MTKIASTDSHVLPSRLLAGAKPSKLSFQQVECFSVGDGWTTSNPPWPYSLPGLQAYSWASIAFEARREARSEVQTTNRRGPKERAEIEENSGSFRIRRAVKRGSRLNCPSLCRYRNYKFYLFLTDNSYEETQNAELCCVPTILSLPEQAFDLNSL